MSTRGLSGKLERLAEFFQANSEFYSPNYHFLTEAAHIVRMVEDAQIVVANKSARGKDDVCVVTALVPGEYRGRNLRLVAAFDEKLPCDCYQCRPLTMWNQRLIVCQTCGSKRCPRAHDHLNQCTGSNSLGAKESK